MSEASFSYTKLWDPVGLKFGEKSYTLFVEFMDHVTHMLSIVSHPKYKQKIAQFYKAMKTEKSFNIGLFKQSSFEQIGFWKIAKKHITKMCLFASRPQQPKENTLFKKHGRAKTNIEK